MKIQILDTFEEEIFDNFLQIVAKKYKLVDQNHFVKKAIFELKYVFWHTVWGMGFNIEKSKGSYYGL